MEMVKYLMIELCISVFHGLNSPSSVPKIDEPFQPASERQSKLGTLDLPPLSSVE